MITKHLRTLYGRELHKLRLEIESYRQENKLWVTEQQLLNSAGNLCLHLIGNLNAYIGAELGGSGYVRNRPAEFADHHVPRAELLKQIDATIAMVDQVLATLTTAQLEAEYPLEVMDGRVSTGYFLLHLAMHLSYHLGQVNYHRRLLDK